MLLIVPEKAIIYYRNFSFPLKTTLKYYSTEPMLQRYVSIYSSVTRIFTTKRNGQKCNCSYLRSSSALHSSYFSQSVCPITKESSLHSCILGYQRTFNFTPSRTSSMWMLRRMARDNLSRWNPAGGSRGGGERHARHISREKEATALRDRERSLRGRASEFELLKSNEQSIPCQLAKGCQERTRPGQDKRNDLAAQSATSSSTGGLHEPSPELLCIMSVRTYSRPVSPCPPHGKKYHSRRQTPTEFVYGEEVVTLSRSYTLENWWKSLADGNLSTNSEL